MSQSHIPVDPSPVTLDDLDTVLTRVFARTDGHHRDADDVQTWVLAARAGRWTRAEVAAATMAIALKFTGFRVMPGHMTEQIAADRATITKRWYCPDPPRHLRDNPAAEIEWRRRAWTSYADRALLALATGQPLDHVPLTLDTAPEPHSALPPAEQTRRMQAMTAQVGERRAIPAAAADHPPITRQTRHRVVLDPDIRRQVRADLAARAPVDPPAASGAA